MSAANDSSPADAPMKRDDESSADDAVSSGKSCIVLALIIAAGACLRLSHLGGKSLWLDEGATVALARASWQHFAWVWWHGEASLQTIYFLLMRGWIRPGSSEAWIRLPSAIFGIASIPLIYALGRKFTSETGAVAAAALLAFNPTHVYFSQEARSYTLAIFVVLLATYFFVRAVEQNRPRYWAVWTLLGVVAFYCHDFTALVFVAQAVSLFFRKTVPWRRFVLCASIIFAGAIPGLTYVFRASPENLRFLWMPRPTAKEFWHLAMFFGGSGAKVALALVLWGAGAVSVVRSRKRSAEAYWRGVLVLLWLIVPVGTLAVLSLRQSMFLQRYLVFSLPAAILLAALGVQQLRKWNLGLALALALCAASAVTIVRDYHKPQEDWRAANRVVLTSAAPGDAVVFFPFYTRIMLDYYGERFPGGADKLRIFAPGYYASGPDAQSLLTAVNKDPQSFPRVWVFQAGHVSGFAAFDESPQVNQKLQSIYGPPTVQHFADVDVLRYGR